MRIVFLIKLKPTISSKSLKKSNSSDGIRSFLDRLSRHNLFYIAKLKLIAIFKKKKQQKNQNGYYFDGYC